MQKEGQDTVGPPRSESDPRDDWLGQDGGDDLEWFEEAPAGRPAGRSATVDGAGRPLPASRDPQTTTRRRREVAIVVAVVAVVGLVIGAIVAIGGTGGGGSPATTATPPATTTPAVTTPTTTPATTKPATTPKPATSGKVTLPAAGKLKPGDTGAEVKTLQHALVEIGAAPSLTVDGKYGPATQSAVVAFQQSNGLTADGIVGPQTAAAINSALAAKG
jgi:hypothetical protein